jgi:hypothetical protein
MLMPGKASPDLFDSTTIKGQLYTVRLSFRGTGDPKLSEMQLHAELCLAKMDKDRCISFF